MLKELPRRQNKGKFRFILVKGAVHISVSTDLVSPRGRWTSSCHGSQGQRCSSTWVVHRNLPKQSITPMFTCRNLFLLPFRVRSPNRSSLSYLVGFEPMISRLRGSDLTQSVTRTYWVAGDCLRSISRDKTRFADERKKLGNHIHGNLIGLFHLKSVACNQNNNTAPENVRNTLTFWSSKFDWID